MSTAEVLVRTDQELASRHASTIVDMLTREGVHHPLHKQLMLVTSKKRVDDGMTASLVRMPHNAVVVDVFREGPRRPDDLHHGCYSYDKVAVLGTLLFQVTCFFDGQGFRIRSFIGMDEKYIPEDQLPRAIKAACEMLRSIR